MRKTQQTENRDTLRKYTFRDFGGRNTDPNAFQCNRGKREERETEGESERGAERNQDIIKQRKESWGQYDLLLFKMEYIENNAATVCTVSRESS